MFKKNCKLLVLVLILTTLYYFSSTTTRSASYLSKLPDNEYKYVQLYTGVFDWKDWDQRGLGKIPFENCPEKRCYAAKPFITQTALEEADGVMVHGPNLWYLPNRKNYRRNRKQIWMYYALESPRGSMCSSHYTSKDLDDWFNLTATYKQDSDFVLDYAPVKSWNDLKNEKVYLDAYQKHVVNKGLDQKIFDKQGWEKYILSSKSRKASAVWFVSHCETASRREKYVLELSKYVDIDIYGRCGKYLPTKPDPCPKGSSDECFSEVLNSYKFYLSFENSLCDDYISEKFWKLYSSDKIYKVNIIPVTRGATEEQFKKVAFPNSYVNAYNYKSPQELGQYMKALSQNDMDYLKYFEWKKQLLNEIQDNYGNLTRNNKADSIGQTAFLKSVNRSPFCKICQKLHNETYMNSQTNRVWNLSEWFGWKKSCWDEDEERRVFFWFTQFLGFCF